MKNLFLILVIFSIAILTGCKKEKVVTIMPEKTPTEISVDDFAILAAKTANRIGKLPLSVVAGNDFKIINSIEQKAFVVLFDSVYSFEGLQPILKEIPLNVKIWSFGHGLLVEDYNDFLNYKNRIDSFHVLSPRPKWIVTIDNENYYIKNNFGLWKKR